MDRAFASYRDLGRLLDSLRATPLTDDQARLAIYSLVLDAEVVLRGSSRPLVIGMGGGGDVVGALATAEFARLYDGARPVLGGVSWERPTAATPASFSFTCRSNCGYSWRKLCFC